MSFITKVKKKLVRVFFSPKLKISSATEHNSLANVDKLNSSQIHWNKCRKSDAIFIESIFADLVRICRINENMKVADYGCGTGVLVNKLKSKYKNIDIKGYDFSENKIEMCRSFYTDTPACCFETGSIYEPNSEKFDLIIATEVLEHLNQPKAAIKNLLSCLNATGAIFLTVPDGRKDTFLGHIHFWSHESWKLFLEEALLGLADFSVGQISGKNYAYITKQ